MTTPLIINKYGSEVVLCPICEEVIIPENGEELEVFPEDMCEHVMGIEFNGELQEGYGWPIVSEWWKRQSENDIENVDFCCVLQSHPDAEFVIEHGGGSNPSYLAFGNKSK